VILAAGAAVLGPAGGTRERFRHAAARREARGITRPAPATSEPAATTMLPSRSRHLPPMPRCAARSPRVNSVASVSERPASPARHQQAQRYWLSSGAQRAP
jgi:hypothetical protein